MRKIAFIFSLILFAGLVYAATTLFSEKSVNVCYDFDNGVNISRSSSTYYSGPGNDWGVMYDNCENNAILVEYACRRVINQTGNFTYLQTWKVDCNCAGGKCI